MPRRWELEDHADCSLERRYMGVRRFLRNDPPFLHYAKGNQRDFLLTGKYGLWDSPEFPGVCLSKSVVDRGISGM